jgi:hypothetical protein
MLDALARIAADPARRVFALMDGARFDDLPGTLAASGLSHRSLYRNVQDAELVRAGPWLVDPYRMPDASVNAWGGVPADAATGGQDPVAADTEAALSTIDGEASQDSGSETAMSADPIQQLERIVSISNDLPAAVFWIGHAGLTEAHLWRHLRTLNVVLIPKGYGEDEPEPLEEGGETHDAVMFRHADGNVLAEVLPVLNAAQFSRAFGPANALMFLAPDHPAPDGSTLRRAVLPNDAPPAPPGMLKLSMDQMMGIEVARLASSRRETMSYLRRQFPRESAKIDDETLYADVSEYERRGYALGLTTMTAHLLFAWLAFTGASAVLETGEFAADVRESGADPNEAIESVFDGMLEARHDASGNS